MLSGAESKAQQEADLLFAFRLRIGGWCGLPGSGERPRFRDLIRGHLAFASSPLGRSKRVVMRDSQVEPLIGLNDVVWNILKI